MTQTRAEAHEAKKKAKQFTYTVNQRERPMGSSFYRGEVANYYPHRGDMRSPSGIPQFLLQGWMPEAPFIDQDTNIVAFGSCFAGNISRYLSRMGFAVASAKQGKTYIQTIADGLVNVHAICQQFEWAWENRVPQVDLWHGWKAEEYGYDEEVRLATKEMFDAADVFILTFGLSEIWYDEPTGEVFWRAVPNDKFDASRHKFRVATIEETLERLRRIRDLIRTHRPSAKIIFTLSPISLAATFRPVNCMTASSASKALLRATIDQLYREVHAKDPHFYYFPSYEIVLLGFREAFNSDLRHPTVNVLNCIMKAFERYFCKTGLTDEDLEVAIGEALEADEILVFADDEQRRAILRGDADEWLNQETNIKRVDKQLLVEKRVAESKERTQARLHEREAKAAAREAVRRDRAAARDARRASPRVRPGRADSDSEE